MNAQIAGGLVADAYGGKLPLAGCILLSSLVALLTPTAANVHIGVVIMLRVLSGLGEGALFPSVHSLTSRWTHPDHRSVIIGTIYSGIDTGTIFGMLMAGYLCDYGFAGGWPSVFYVFGTAGCVWSVAWLLLCYNSPATHPRMSKAERDYWAAVADTTDEDAAVPVPCKEIFKSIPVWALSIAFLAEDWGFFTIVTCIPLFIHDVLGFNMLTNGLVSGFPFIVSGILTPLNGLLVDWLRAPGRLSTNVVRKGFTAGGFSVTACSFVLLSLAGCNRTLAVIIIFTATVGSALSYPNVAVNIFDLAPAHAGKLMGLVYTVVNLGAIGAPMVVGSLTYHGSTRQEWKIVFYIGAAVYITGALVFVIFGSAKLQSWANNSAEELDGKQPLDSIRQSDK